MAIPCGTTGPCQMGQVCCFTRIAPYAECIDPANFKAYNCESMPPPMPSCLIPKDCDGGAVCCLQPSQSTITCQPQGLCPGGGVGDTYLTCASDLDCPKQVSGSCTTVRRRGPGRGPPRVLHPPPASEQHADSERGAGRPLIDDAVVGVAAGERRRLELEKCQQAQVRRSQRLHAEPQADRQPVAGGDAGRAHAVERRRPLEALVDEADQRAREQRQRLYRPKVERRLDLGVELRVQVQRGRLGAGVEGAGQPNADRDLIDLSPE